MTSKLDWSSLTLGSLTREEIVKAIGDRQWQQYRILLIGRSLPSKFHALEWWIENGSGELKDRKVQVTNYVNALKRGGLIK